MHAVSFGKAFLIGFSIAAPVGPIAMLIIRRTLTHGRLAGLASGFGAATADAMYAAVAGFSLTAISSLLIKENLWIRGIGGLLLVFVGLKIIRTPTRHDHDPATGHNGLLWNYASTVLLTLTNPMTIIPYAAAFAAIGANASRTTPPIAGGKFVVGVFCGASCWWLFLTTITCFLGYKLTSKSLRWINLIAGAIILAFGVGAFVTAIVALR